MTNRLQTLGALAFALIAVSVSATAVYKTLSPGAEGHALIPTIGSERLLYGQVSTAGIPIREYSPEEAMAGIVLEKDTHNFFSCPLNVNRVEIDGSLFGNIRFWIYEFTGGEPPFNGAFFISLGELAVNPQFSAINTLKIFTGGKRYYLMTEHDLRFRCGVSPALTAEFCGDGVCSTGESAETCHQDCGKCGDGQVTGDEQCDSVPHCTSECKPETGYKCENNECTPLIPELPGDNDEDDKFVACDTGTMCDKAVFGGTCTQMAIDCKGQGGGFTGPVPTGQSCGNFACSGQCYKCPNTEDSKCSDTDGGDDMFVKGTATINGNSGTDFCASDIVVAEYSCGFGFLESLKITCEHGCKDGACIRPTEQDSIELHSASVEEDSISILYSKNFDTCAHIYKKTGKIDQRINFICEQGANLTAIADMGDFNERVSVGDTIKICHGNNGNICSDFVTVRGASASTGNLFVTQDITPLRNRQLLGGMLGEAVLRLSLRAENENIDVTDLQLSAVPVTGSIDRFELFLIGQSVKFADATRAGCGTDNVPHDGNTFCAHMDNQQLVVAQGNVMDIVIRPLLKTDTQGGASGDAFTMYLNGSPIADVHAGAMRARGLNSNNALLANDGDSEAEGEIFIGTDTPAPNLDIAGKDENVVMAKITSISNANPDADGTAVPTGRSSIGQFRFTAASHANTNNGMNDVVLSDIVFDIEANNVALNANDFRFFNKADATTTAPCKPYYLTGEPFGSDYISGVFLVKCQNLQSSGVNTEIDAGQNTTLVLEGSIILPNINTSEPSSLQVKFTRFENIENSYAKGTSHIRWLDKDQVNATSFDWIEYPETVVKSTLYAS